MVSKRSKDMVSNPIADAHEQRAQSEKDDSEANGDYFGSHVPIPVWILVGPSAPIMPKSFIPELTMAN
jgi:hypothetical protein